MSAPESYEEELLRRIDPAALKRNDNRFVPKLRFEERCAVLGLSLMGVSQQVLAAAFELNRRTVGHIVNAYSPHYKNVRKELQNFGREEFIKRYVTEEHIQRINSDKTKERAAATWREYERERGERKGKPNPRSHGSAGTHMEWNYNTKATHRIEIRWLNFGDDGAVNGEGWYCRDLDEPNPDMQAWLGYEHTLMTSSAALKYARDEVCGGLLYKAP